MNWSAVRCDGNTALFNDSMGKYAVVQGSVEELHTELLLNLLSKDEKTSKGAFHFLTKLERYREMTLEELAVFTINLLRQLEEENGR